MTMARQQSGTSFPEEVTGDVNATSLLATPARPLDHLANLPSTFDAVGRRLRPIVRSALWWVAIGVSVSSCSTFRETYEISSPKTFPSGIRGSIGGDGRTTFELEGLVLRIKAMNARQDDWPRYYSQRPLMIFFDLDPREEGYAFNPMAVRVTRDGTNTVAPGAYIGPGRAPDIGECVGPGARPLERSTSDQAFDVIPNWRFGTCFVLVFETPSSPDTDYQLVLDGLSRGGQAVSLPELSFSKRVVRSIAGPDDWRPEALYP
jgi:hypothetical protein